MNKIEVSVSFDIEHDGELYKELLAQSRTPGSGFAVLSGSEHFNATEGWSDRVRHRTRRADQVIVICGEHTDEAIGVSTELRIAQEQQKPYFLLWGRRDTMCTKPLAAKPSDGMYSWTSEIINEQIAGLTRQAHREETARAMKRPERSDSSGGNVATP